MCAHRRPLASIVILAFCCTEAIAQTKTPNAGSAQTLRTWPRTALWQTLLTRREDQTLSCLMLSASMDGGKVQYLAGIRQLPKELALVVGDRDPSGVSGDHIRLIVDNVEIGSYAITRRADSRSEI